MSIKIETKAVILVPVDPSEVPNGALFLDSSNGNAPTVKSTGGTVAAIQAAAANLFQKVMEAAEAIPIKVPVSKLPNGKIIKADSDLAGGQNVIGYSMSVAVGNGSQIAVLTIGANLEGALTGLGFSPGQDVFLGETGGYTTNPGGFTGDNDSVIKVGVADCAAGSASSVATDLVVFAEVILRP